ncbi:uncharacterized protein FIBRA_00786 [Fibroporia radiculosa]|uniref:Uncharacterized protein n=1 Tax=Fibroporia radiculosa TaxID=599839 RepID=J4I847_9APHY|nr:uncharacterized protein FIBRA_00786 [Fibroporia radiculosa]CCL98781.1 predicted protein [Fibroporia radiculosa]
MSAIIPIVARTAFKRVVAVPGASVAPSFRFYSSATHANDPLVLETEKHRNLSKNQHKTSTTIDNAPGWNEYLASDSEANVKADRSTHDFDGLQQSTVKHIRNRHHTNDSPLSDPREQATNTNRMDDSEVVEAVYERDEVSGPLSGAASGSEFVEEEEVERVTRHRSAPAK